MLTHLENFNRQNILALWDEPYCRSEPPTQETVAAESEDDTRTHVHTTPDATPCMPHHALQGTQLSTSVTRSPVLSFSHLSLDLM
jgi:hypothetical protein